MDSEDEHEGYFFNDDVDEGMIQTSIPYRPNGGLGNLGGLSGMLRKSDQPARGLGGLGSKKPVSKPSGGIGGLGGLGGLGSKKPVSKPSGGIGGLAGLGGLGSKKPLPKAVEDKSIEFQNKILKGLELIFEKNYEYQDKLLEKMEALTVSPVPRDDEERLVQLKDIIVEKLRSHEAFVYLPNLGSDDEGTTMSLERFNELHTQPFINVVHDLADLLD